MIGLFIMYLVGKGFYDLAGKNQKNQWLFGISGVASYYAVQLIVGFGLGIYWGIQHGEDQIDTMLDDNYWIMTIAGVTLGALSCWAYYEFLKMRWSKEVDRVLPLSGDLLDDGLILDDDMIVG